MERYVKLLHECYEMLELQKKDLMMRKVYSDVNFYALIDEIEEYLSDLKTAEEIFCDKKRCLK